MSDPTDTLGPLVSDRMAVLPQYLLPKQALTAAAGALAQSRGGALTTAVIRWFIGRYGVNMAEAAEPDPAAYPTFNQFFTRALKPGARIAVLEGDHGGQLIPGRNIEEPRRCQGRDDCGPAVRRKSDGRGHVQHGPLDLVDQFQSPQLRAGGEVVQPVTPSEISGHSEPAVR